MQKNERITVCNKVSLDYLSIKTIYVQFKCTHTSYVHIYPNVLYFSSFHAKLIRQQLSLTCLSGPKTGESVSRSRLSIGMALINFCFCNMLQIHWNHLINSIINNVPKQQTHVSQKFEQQPKPEV